MREVTEHCLFNWVGIEHCSLGVSGSGAYINDLAGIYTEQAQKIASKEEINFLNIFNKVQKRAFVRIESDVVAQLSTAVKFNEIICQTKKLQPRYNDIVVVGSAAEYRGLYIQSPQSKYSVINVKAIYIYSSETTDKVTNIKIFDLNDGKELFTQEITVEPGLNTFDLDEDLLLRYKILQVFVGIDCTDIATIETDSVYFDWYDHEECVFQGNFSPEREAYFYLSAATLLVSETALYDNIKLSGLGKGVTIDADISCSAEQFICENKKRFTDALTYVLGAEMIGQALGSPNVNKFTINNPDQLIYFRDDYESKYKSAIKRAINAIPLHGEGECFNCEPIQNITTQGNMP